MPTVENGSTRTLTVYAGEVLTVTANAGPGFVWCLPPKPGENLPPLKVVKVEGGASQDIGPFAQTTQWRLDAQNGPLAYAVTQSQADPAVPLSEKRTTMALQDKLKLLAARAKKLPADIEAAADKLSARIDSVDTRALASFASMHSVLDDAEKAVAATEDAANQLTNGGPTQ